jgi:hypothetical protein
MRQLAACCRLLVVARWAPSIAVAGVTQQWQRQRTQVIGGSGAAVGVASSNRCLGQCDEERRLDALGRRLVSRRTAGIALVMRVWPEQRRRKGRDWGKAVRG